MPISPRPGAEYDPWVDGWKDYQGNDHDGVPSDGTIADGAVQGMFVRFVNISDSEDVQYMWAMALQNNFYSWEEWYLYIDSLLEMYGGQLS